VEEVPWCMVVAGVAVAGNADVAADERADEVVGGCRAARRVAERELVPEAADKDLADVDAARLAIGTPVPVGTGGAAETAETTGAAEVDVRQSPPVLASAEGTKRPGRDACAASVAVVAVPETSDVVEWRAGRDELSRAECSRLQRRQRSRRE